MQLLLQNAQVVVCWHGYKVCCLLSAPMSAMSAMSIVCCLLLIVVGTQAAQDQFRPDANCYFASILASGDKWR